MTMLVRILDQALGSAAAHLGDLPFALQVTTAREIVKAKVAAELAREREQLQQFAQAMEPWGVQPRLRDEALATAGQKACAAIEAGRVIMLFEGRQVADLDAPLVLNAVSEARFIRLVPLVGG